MKWIERFLNEKEKNYVAIISLLWPCASHASRWWVCAGRSAAEERAHAVNDHTPKFKLTVIAVMTFYKNCSRDVIGVRHRGNPRQHGGPARRPLWDGYFSPRHFVTITTKCFAQCIELFLEVRGCNAAHSYFSLPHRNSHKGRSWPQRETRDGPLESLIWLQL